MPVIIWTGMEKMKMTEWMKMFEVWYEYAERLRRNPDDEVAKILEPHYAKQLDKMRGEMLESI